MLTLDDICYEDRHIKKKVGGQILASYVGQIHTFDSLIKFQ